MTLRELDDNLPNGLHDVYLTGMDVSFATATAALCVSLDVGDSAERSPRYENAEIPLEGMLAFVAD